MPVSSHVSPVARDICADVDGPFIEHTLDREHGGDVYAWARHACIDSAEIIDFSASINPLGPPTVARKAFQKSYEAISHYPDSYGGELKEALAKYHGMKAAEILLGNGSTQLIYLLSFALRPRTALVVGPTFSEQANALTVAGAKVSFFSLTTNADFEFSTQDFMAAWGKAHHLAFITTPNSLSGRLIPKAEIEKIARIALLTKRFLVIDEAFIDFVEGESVKHLIRANPYVVILRSLTKYFALPGLRLGYLLAHARRVAQLTAYLEPWSVSGPAQKVALACLADPSFGLKAERWLQRERKFLAQALVGLKGFAPYPSNANFLLVRIVNHNADALQLRAFLLRRNILIRACNSFAGLGSDHFRIAVRQRKDNLRLLEALKEWMAGSLP